MSLPALSRLPQARPPVREALQRLATNGLVVPASRGWLIAGINENDLRELFELRRLLEPVGLDKLVRADDRAIAELSGFFDEFRDGIEPAEYDRYFERDGEFHNRIVEASGNSRVIRFYSIVETQIDRGRHFLSRGFEGRAETNLDEHLEICGAIGRRDADRARAALLHHLHRGEELMASHIRAERRAGRLDDTAPGRS
ncbi:MAG: hypothetical protein JWO67_2972 [Streptosporangiaceae bacterium]|nr:hypothetical protein [Streptosporangiaceae bacterium]